MAKTRKGAAAVIYRIKEGKPEFLILHRVRRWTGWEMLKGGRKGKGGALATLKRELSEEIGAERSKTRIVGRIPFILKFKTSPDYTKQYGFTHMELPSFLVEYNGKANIRKNEVIEHDKYTWLPLKDAIKILKYSTSKNELKAAHKFMKSKGII